MSLLGSFGDYIIPFVLVLSALVFVHEFGHYWVARRCKVRVEVFSIGFGPELFGINDRAGTRWRVSLIPLGGYVKMFGDLNAASQPIDEQNRRAMTPEERAVAFPFKSVGQRAAIVAAGPIANFLFAIVVLFGLFATAGHPFPPAMVGAVVPGSPAEQAGLRAGDRVVAVNGRPIDRFAELAVMVARSAGKELSFDVRGADGQLAVIAVSPRMEAVTRDDGTTVEVWRLGVAADVGPFDVLTAGRLSVTETGSLIWETLKAVGQMVTGERGTEELGGPIRIAQISGDVAKNGLVPLIWLGAILSINLGLINLFPIPLLDGGHLSFYAIEAVRGRPLGPRAQEYGFRLGLALVLTLMVFATWNDLVQLNVFAFLANLIS